MVTVAPTRYAVTTHESWSRPPRSPTIVGSAVATIVWSSDASSIASRRPPKVSMTWRRVRSGEVMRIIIATRNFWWLYQLTSSASEASEYPAAAMRVAAPRAAARAAAGLPAAAAADVAARRPSAPTLGVSG